jgi:hypothetical protein
MFWIVGLLDEEGARMLRIAGIQRVVDRCRTRSRGERNMAPKDFSVLLKDAPMGEWIALSKAEDRIIATAVTLDEAMDLAIERGEDSPVMMKAPPPWALVL